MVAHCGDMVVLAEEQRHQSFRQTDSQITTRTSAAFRLRELRMKSSLCWLLSVSATGFWVTSEKKRETDLWTSVWNMFYMSEDFSADSLRSLNWPSCEYFLTFFFNLYDSHFNFWICHSSVRKMLWWSLKSLVSKLTSDKAHNPPTCLH